MLIALAAVTTVTACDEDQRNTAIDAGCDMAPIAMRAISVFLKFSPMSPASFVGDVGAILAANSCKYLLKQITEDTTPVEHQERLENPPDYAPVNVGFRLPMNSEMCLQREGRYTTAITGALLGVEEGYGSHPRTSCEFAINVVNAYLAAGGAPVDEYGSPRAMSVMAYSPVMGRMYEMYCDGFYPVVCRGGDNAVVYAT